MTPFAFFLIGSAGGERDPFHSLTKPSMSDDSEGCSAKIPVACIYGFLFVVILNHFSNLS